MNYEHIRLRRDQVETLKKYSDDIGRRFDVEFYVCGSQDGGFSLGYPTHFVVFIRTKNPESQENVPLAKAFVASLMKDAGDSEDGKEAEDEILHLPWVQSSVVTLGISSPSALTHMTTQVNQHHHKPISAPYSSTSNDDGAESNHDSCYDTDEELANHKAGCQSDSHEDVSRTTSDTLAAEHSDHLDEHEAYAARKEFAVKLGYTEELLKSALSKLGTCASQNELLEELIILSSSRTNQQMDEHVPMEVPLPEDHQPCQEASITQMPMQSASEDDDPECSNLRDIVIDGSNVAMSHGNKEVFSCQGIRLAVHWFQQKGHKKIVVFVPQWRKEAPRPDAPLTDQEVLLELEREGILKFTPSRRVKGKRVTCYDDRYILKLASETGGIVVSNDNYRDLLNDSEEYKQVIEERLLMYTFVQDRFMPPDDPQGRYGPTLDNFLCKKPTISEVLPRDCPYGKKCTFGNKCKFYHPERKNQPHRMVADKLAEHAKLFKASQEGDLDKRHPFEGSPVKKPLTKTTSLQPRPAAGPVKKVLSRTRSLIPPVYLEEPKVEHSLPAPHLTLTTPAQVDQHKWESKEELANVLKQKLTLTSAEGSKTEEPSSMGLPHNSYWMMPHEALRATHSDPYQCFGGGHLALAKKLSDEGRSSPGSPYKYGKGSRENSVECEHPDEWAKPSSGQLSQQNKFQVKNRHTKVARQLSLKGCEDPRWQLKQAKGNSQLSPSNQHKKTVHRSASENTFTNKGATWTYNREPAHFGPPPPMPYSAHFGHMILPNMSQPPPRTKLPLTRNESAPGAPSRHVPEQSPVGPPFGMTRQISSSDSQLHVLSSDAVQQSVINIPFEHSSNTANWVGSYDQQTASEQRQGFHSLPRGSDMNVQAKNMSDTTREQQCLNAGLVYYPLRSHHNIPDSVKETHGPPDPQTLSPPNAACVPLLPPPGGAGLLKTPMAVMQIPTPPQPGPVSQASTLNKGDLYYHLCGLFGKDKVERVMIENPNVTDAKLLCALIVQMPD